MTVHVLNTRVLFKRRVYNIELQGISKIGVKIPIYRAVAVRLRQCALVTLSVVPRLRQCALITLSLVTSRVKAHLPHFPSSHVS